MNKNLTSLIRLLHKKNNELNLSDSDRQTLEAYQAGADLRGAKYAYARALHHRAEAIACYSNAIFSD